MNRNLAPRVAIGKQALELEDQSNRNEKRRGISKMSLEDRLFKHLELQQSQDLVESYTSSILRIPGLNLSRQDIAFGVKYRILCSP